MKAVQIVNSKKCNSCYESRATDDPHFTRYYCSKEGGLYADEPCSVADWRVCGKNPWAQLHEVGDHPEVWVVDRMGKMIAAAQEVNTE